MACRNMACKYNDAHNENGCKLFPGATWISCRGASVKPVAAAPKTTTKMKGK